MLSVFLKKIGFKDRKTAPPLPKIHEATPLSELITHYPNTLSFFQSRFGILPHPTELSLGLRCFAEKHRLPPAQILYMEIQLQGRLERVQCLKPHEAKALIEATPTLKILDVREGWERKMGNLPGAIDLDTNAHTELLQSPKQTPILVYCHFGIRSLDAAAHLTDLGFTEVHALVGGIDAWSLEVDPSIPRYCGSYC